MKSVRSCILCVKENKLLKSMKQYNEFNKGVIQKDTTFMNSENSKTFENKNGESVSHLEITKVVLVYCSIVSNDYQHDSRVLHIFAANKSFGELSDISPEILYF